VPEQVWESTIDGRVHRVESSGEFTRTLVWWIDSELVAEKTSIDDKVTLKPNEAPFDGSLQVRFSPLGAPRRATLLAAGLGELGVGGVDLAPEPGSAAAAYHEKLLARPGRYTAIATLGGVAKVVVPILIAALLARLAVKIPWPDIDLPLPSIPWPDLPRIPWPDINLPDVPWPDVSLPGWLEWLLDHLRYFWPVALAFVLARAEINRRRKHVAAVEMQRRTSDVTRADAEEPPEDGDMPKR
jgi:hypothetical protein